MHLKGTFTCNLVRKNAYNIYLKKNRHAALSISYHNK